MEGAPKGSSSHGLVWGSRTAAAHHRVSCLCWLCRWPFEQDVEQGNTDGLGDCQSKQGPLPSHSAHSPSFSTLSFSPSCLSGLSLDPVVQLQKHKDLLHTHINTHTSLTEAFIVTYSLSYTKLYRSLFSADYNSFITSFYLLWIVKCCKLLIFNTVIICTVVKYYIYSIYIYYNIIGFCYFLIKHKH